MLRGKIDMLWKEVEGIEVYEGEYNATLDRINQLISLGMKEKANKATMAELFYMKGYWIYQESEEYKKARIAFHQSLAYKSNYFWSKLYMGHTLFDMATNSTNTLIAKPIDSTLEYRKESVALVFLEAQFFFNQCANSISFLKKLELDWRIVKLYELQASICLYLADYESFKERFAKYQNSLESIDSIDIPVPTELLLAFKFIDTTENLNIIEPISKNQLDTTEYVNFLESLESELIEE